MEGRQGVPLQPQVQWKVWTFLLRVWDVEEVLVSSGVIPEIPPSDQDLACWVSTHLWPAERRQHKAVWTRQDFFHGSIYQGNGVAARQHRCTFMRGNAPLELTSEQTDLHSSAGAFCQICLVPFPVNQQERTITEKTEAGLGTWLQPLTSALGVRKLRRILHWQKFPVADSPLNLQEQQPLLCYLLRGPAKLVRKGETNWREKKLI